MSAPSWRKLAKRRYTGAGGPTDDQDSGNNTSPALIGLPEDIRASIALHLDLHSALSFAQTCKTASISAGHRIWRDINLVLHQNYGERPLIQPYKTDSSVGYPEWTTMMSDTVQVRHREGLESLVNTIIGLAAKRGWKSIRKVSIETGAGLLPCVLQLFWSVSTGLTELNLQPRLPTSLVYDPPFRLPTELNWIADLNLARLTHLRLQGESIQYGWQLPMLCHSTPNLACLDVEIDVQDDDGWSADFCDVSPAVRRMPDLTRLRHLRIAYWDRSSDVASDRSLLSDLLLHSSRVVFLTIVGARGPYGWRKEILDIIKDWPELRGLNCDFRPDEFYQMDKSESISAFPNLRRLASSGPWQESVTALVSLPALEEMIILTLAEGRHLPLSTALLCPALPRPAQLPVAPVVAHMLSSPKLRVVRHGTAPAIDYDMVHVDLERINAAATVEDRSVERIDIRSYRSCLREENELLHFRLLSACIKIDDVPENEHPNPYIRGRLNTVSERYRDGVNCRVITYQSSDHAIWQDFTYFDGRCVPLKVIERMREVEGAPAEQWEQRGVEVGSQGWKVLTDWRDETGE